MIGHRERASPSPYLTIPTVQHSTIFGRCTNCSTGLGSTQQNLSGLLPRVMLPIQQSTQEEQPAPSMLTWIGSKRFRGKGSRSGITMLRTTVPSGRTRSWLFGASTKRSARCLGPWPTTKRTLRTFTGGQSGCRESGGPRTFYFGTRTSDCSMVDGRNHTKEKGKTARTSGGTCVSST